jgi:hypothetical protein
MRSVKGAGLNEVSLLILTGCLEDWKRLNAGR